MPIISMFLGIIISMYYDDHMPPHFHAEYNGEEAVFNLDGEVITGELPRKQTRLVQAWVELHRDELGANWQTLGKHGELFRIEPLR